MLPRQAQPGSLAVSVLTILEGVGLPEARGGRRSSCEDRGVGRSYLTAVAEAAARALAGAVAAGDQLAASIERREVAARASIFGVERSRMCGRPEARGLTREHHSMQCGATAVLARRERRRRWVQFA